MRFTNLNIPTASDVVVMHFEDLILDGVLEPGTDIPSERKLAETLGVSRTTLRDALGRLQSKGLLFQTEGGTQVHNIFDIMINKPLDSLYGVDPDDLLEMWVEMACSAAELSATRLSPQDLKRFKVILSTIEQAFNEKPSQVGLGKLKNVMNGLALASYNFVLLQVFKFLNDLVFGSSDDILAEIDQVNVIEITRALVDALDRGDPGQASKTTKKLARLLVSSKSTQLQRPLNEKIEANIAPTLFDKKDHALLELRKLLASEESLPKVKDLAARFDLPLASVKSAITTLTALGEVEVGPKGGILATKSVPAHPQDILIDLINSRVHALEAIFEFRIILERMTSALAAKRRTQSHLKILSQKLDHLEKNINVDEKDPAVVDIEFHAAIAIASGNEAMQAITHELITFFRRTTRGWLKKHELHVGSLAKINDQHRRIFDAINESNPKAARRAMEEHLYYVIKMLYAFKISDQRIQISSLRFDD